MMQSNNMPHMAWASVRPASITMGYTASPDKAF